MAYEKAKVYSDGSHYIAIPHEFQPHKKRNVKPPEANQVLNESKEKENAMKNHNESELVASAKIDIKELFETLYKENNNKKHLERNEEIIKGLKPYIENEEELKVYVFNNIQRKIRNLIERRKRFVRKVYLQKWSYFCTFTYDDKLHTEESFRTKLSNALKKLSSRKNWKYAGVWERSPTNQRLHFHALVYIPNNDLVFIEKRDYNTKIHQMQTTYQNQYFLERFGRNDFSEVDTHNLGNSIAYIMKYLAKSGEKIVYSKNLPTYFISDIMDDDVVCNIGVENRKLLLFDNFTCWDEGVKVGTVSPETISQLKTKN